MAGGDRAAVSSGMVRIYIPALDLTGDTDTGELSRDAWPELVRWIRERGPYSASQLGGRVGVHGRAVREWTAGDSIPSPPARRLLLALAREILMAGRT